MDVSDGWNWCGVLLIIALGAVDCTLPDAAVMSLPDVRVSLVPGVVDKTPYSFSTDENDVFRLEKLTFDHDALPEGVMDLESLVAYRLDQLKGVTPGDVIVGPIAVVELDGLLAHSFGVEQTSQGKSIHTQCIMALGKEHDYYQLAYLVPTNDSRSFERFREIYRSFRFSDSRNGPVPAGFIRRSVGVATLDVPAKLRAPAQLLFSITDIGDTIEVDIHPQGRAGTAISMAQEIADDAAVADAVSPHPVELRDLNGIQTELVNYVLTSVRMDETREIVVWRARLHFSSGTVVSAVMRHRKDTRFSERSNAFAALLRRIHEQD